MALVSHFSLLFVQGKQLFIQLKRKVKQKIKRRRVLLFIYLFIIFFEAHCAPNAMSAAQMKLRGWEIYGGGLQRARFEG